MLQKANNIDLIIKAFTSQFNSNKTKEVYIKEVKVFLEFLKAHNLHIKGLKPMIIQEYINSYKAKYSISSLNQKISVLKSFFKWLEVNDMIEYNPTRALKLFPAKVGKPTLAFTDEEIKALINCPDTTKVAGNCHRLVLILASYLGLRRAEILKIRYSDIMSDRGHEVLCITGKGNKTRHLPLPKIVKEEIERYRNNYKKITGLDIPVEDLLLQLTSKISKKEISPSTIVRIVKRYAKLIGVDKRVSPHSCRATAISHLLEKNVSIRNVADFAGHSSTITTQLYDKKRDGYKNSAVYEIEY